MQEKASARLRELAPWQVAGFSRPSNVRLNDDFQCEKILLGNQKLPYHAHVISIKIRSGDASNDDHGTVTGITTTTGRANLDDAPTANDDGVIDVFAQDDFRDVQVALEKVRLVKTMHVYK